MVVRNLLIVYFKTGLKMEKDKLYEQIDKSTILRAEVGSRLYGTNLGDSGDRDELGVCIEDLQQSIGFNDFEQYVYRTAAERTGNHDEPSGPGDLDLTIYSLRKFLRLALSGNPTILQLLFIPSGKAVKRDALGSRLQEMSSHIVSRRAGGAFLGYLQAQRQRMLGERGGSHGVAHSEDKAKFGYDTKYATHMLRLGFQGVELLTTGSLTFPVPEAEYLREVRGGKSNAQAVLTRTGELEREIKSLLDVSTLPKEPNKAAVEEWMIKTYWWTWKARHAHPHHPLTDRLIYDEKENRLRTPTQGEIEAKGTRQVDS